MLMSEFDEHVLRPGAFARTPFGTPFFRLFTYPDIDASELRKRRLTRRMREEIATWERLQLSRQSKRSEKRADADVLQEDRAVTTAVEVAVEAGERRAGAGCGVRGDGYPDCSVPSVDAGPARGDVAVVHEIEGFVVIDMGDDARLASSNHNPTRCSKAEPAKESSGLLSRVLGLFTPIGTMDW